MLTGLLRKIFGSKNDREIQALFPIVQQINSLETQISALGDNEFQPYTARLKEKYHNGSPLNDLLPEAFALTREASKRVLGMRHYDVQLLGGMVLNSGKIAEMKTGEGKTLVATLPIYLNALTGKGVHLVTVNEYLAARDAEWMGKIYRFLGLTVGTSLSTLRDGSKKRQYQCDVVYGTNSEFGFDYLRDNMKFNLQQYVQRDLYYAIIDEVDSILIDEARTPLIISGSPEDSSEKYLIVNRIIPKLQIERDYTVDEKSKSSHLTEDGVNKVEEFLQVQNLYAPENIEWLHHVNKGLLAYALYKRDVDYLVEDGKVKIIDEFTGRTMEGRRWSDGLHQAIEAKEGVKIEQENQTLATITYQNFFRLYEKISGMTGTADTEAEEFAKIYNLDVVVIPTNKSMIRKDNQDLIYKTEREKLTAIVDDIVKSHEKQQPVLVGTISVEKSEILSKILKKQKIPHHVLNAKYHLSEAEIIAQAGRLGALTISTNMAGRGTDILLGGNPEFLARQDVANVDINSRAGEQEKLQTSLEKYKFLSGSPDSIPINLLVRQETRGKELSEEEIAEIQKKYEHLIHQYGEALERYKALCGEEKAKVIEAGGLHIIGTERHESRRIDNQLRGRSGRQGDPGSSRFYLSLEDDLMRIFGGDRMKNLMERMGMEDNVPIEHRWVTKAIENAQKRVEGHNFDIRKHLLEYDDVMNMQRKTIYNLRRKVLGREDMKDDILDLIDATVIALCDQVCFETVHPEEWDLSILAELAKNQFGLSLELKNEPKNREHLENFIYQAAEKAYLEKCNRLDTQFVVIGEDGILPREQKPTDSEESESINRYLIRYYYLREIDTSWKEHLQQMEHLKEGIHLRGYAQKDPKLEYKKEGFELFIQLMQRIGGNVLEKLMRVEIMASQQVEEMAKKEASRQKVAEKNMNFQAGQTAKKPEPQKVSTIKRDTPKVGRNDLCYCGSGKKYKKCHLLIDGGDQRAAV